MILNIETTQKERVLSDIKEAFHTDKKEVEVTLKEHEVTPIINIEIKSKQPRCISLEALKEMLYYIEDYKIRIII